MEILRAAVTQKPLLAGDRDSGRAELAVCVATGDDRLCANVLLTIGYVPPA
jgi:hypothetical protein